jgi:hypothetical protein
MSDAHCKHTTRETPDAIVQQTILLGQLYCRLYSVEQKVILTGLYRCISPKTQFLLSVVVF